MACSDGMVYDLLEAHGIAARLDSRTAAIVQAPDDVLH